MHYLGSNSCHVIGFHISIIKYMCACSPQVATRDSKQYLQQLMLPESVMGVYRKGGVVLQVTKARYLMSVNTENNGVSVSRQCLSYKCHVSNIDFHKSPFRNPYRHQQLHLLPHYALDIPEVKFCAQ